MSFLNEENEDARDILVYGVAYTPDWSVDTPVVNVYKPNHMTDDLAKQTVGLPVFVEHDCEYPIGNVADAFVDETRNLNTFLHVKGNPLANKKLPSALAVDASTRRRHFSGLSMGTDVLLDDNSKCYTQVSAVVPTEVSIVKNPDRPKSYIKDYWVLPRLDERETQQYIKDIIRAESSK